jgi:hypothetical protein
MLRLIRSAAALVRMLPILNLGCEENWRGGNGKMMILLQENKKTTQNKKAKKRKSKFFISRQFYT